MLCQETVSLCGSDTCHVEDAVKIGERVRVTVGVLGPATGVVVARRLFGRFLISFVGGVYCEVPRIYIETLRQAG